MLAEPCDDPRALAMSWISNRESENWALISGTSLASEIHGWVAHEVLMRNYARQSMKSNSLDGEFIRLLSERIILPRVSTCGLSKGDVTRTVNLSGEDDDEMFHKHADAMGFQI